MDKLISKIKTNRSEEELMSFASSYLGVLHGTFENLNLISSGLKNNLNLFYFSQVLDSIYPIIAKDENGNFSGSKIFLDAIKRSGVIIDVGFGGGFPLLPLAFILSENVQFIGIDSITKKVIAVKQIIEQLGFKSNITLLNERVENFEIDRDVVIVFRAVGDIRGCLKKIKVINKNQNVWVFFYKGPNLYNKEGYKDIDELKKSLAKKWDLVEEYKYATGQNENLCERLFIGFKRKQ
ncbi:MAG: class I SAM-dependent methyltransferase [Oligoflexia bacterium]|nr:class I SAM-dependent methyltransferase [Oligoflexia bacterium]